jgi:hypothetical protein
MHGALSHRKKVDAAIKALDSLPPLDRKVDTAYLFGFVSARILARSRRGRRKKVCRANL